MSTFHSYIDQDVLDLRGDPKIPFPKDSVFGYLEKRKILEQCLSFHTFPNTMNVPKPTPFLLLCLLKMGIGLPLTRSSAEHMLDTQLDEKKQFVFEEDRVLTIELLCGHSRNEDVNDKINLLNTRCAGRPFYGHFDFEYLPIQTAFMDLAVKADEHVQDLSSNKQLNEFELFCGFMALFLLEFSSNRLTLDFDAVFSEFIQFFQNPANYSRLCPPSLPMFVSFGDKYFGSKNPLHYLSKHRCFRALVNLLGMPSQSQTRTWDLFGDLGLITEKVYHELYSLLYDYTVFPRELCTIVMSYLYL